MNDAISRESLLKLYEPLGDSKVLASQVCIDAKALPPVSSTIIHCKDCKFYKTIHCIMDIHHEDITIYVAKPNDYCSYAEKRKDNA